MTTNKYRVDPRRVDGRKDIADIVGDLQRRIIKNENSLRIGNTSIEDGDLIVRNGDIVVSETDGSESLRIFHGSVPEIRMFPLGVDASHHVALFGLDFGTTTPITAVQLGIEKVSTAVDGGKILLLGNGAVLSYQPDGGNEMYIWLNIVDDVIAMRGKWLDQGDFDNRQALSTGSIAIEAGFGSVAWSYNFTMASKMAPIIGLVNTAGLVTSWNLTAMSTSGFTVTWSGTLAKTVNFWSYRL